MIPRSGHDLNHDQILSLVGASAGLILEIGANDGTDTVEMARRFPNALIFCFECDPRAISKFKATLGLNSTLCDSRVFLHEIALADRNGFYRFFPSGGAEGSPVHDWDKSGSLCQPTGHLTRSPEITFGDPIVVECRKLDDLGAGWLNGIDFIRLDTQGAERLVFAGGRETLKRTRWMLAECHRTELYDGQLSEADMIASLPGWHCHGRWADDLLFENLAHRPLEKE